MDRKPDLKVDVRHPNFSFSSQSSGSSFSGTPTIYTPNSGRSSPLYADSVQFDPCFPQSASFSFGYSPPSSVDSAQCPFSWELVSATSALLDTAPSTPSRCNNNSNAQFMLSDNSMLQYTPPHSADLMTFHDPSTPGQFISPVRTFYGPVRTPEHTEPWTLFDNSSLSCSIRRDREPSIVAVPSCKAEPASPRQNVDVTHVQQKSAALQEVQRPSHTRKRPRTKFPNRAAKHQTAREQDVVPKNRFWCTAGCPDKSYTRREHLARHIRTIHEGYKYGICQCCLAQNPPVTKEFDRRDNYLTHMALHATGKARVEKHPLAKVILEKEEALTRRRGPCKK